MKELSIMLTFFCEFGLIDNNKEFVDGVIVDRIMCSPQNQVTQDQIPGNYTNNTPAPLDMGAYIGACKLEAGHVSALASAY